jgi:hypothetical protein
MEPGERKRAATRKQANICSLKYALRFNDSANEKIVADWCQRGNKEIKSKENNIKYYFQRYSGD